MAEIRHLVHINAPCSTIYQAITEEEGLRGWWTIDTVASSEVGAIIEFKFGSKYHDKMRLIRLESDKKVEWVCLEGDSEWLGTTFIFDLEPMENNTILRFTHGNWHEATDFFASCNYHWGYYLRSLKLYCETGQGTPFSDSV